MTALADGTDSLDGPDDAEGSDPDHESPPKPKSRLQLFGGATLSWAIVIAVVLITSVVIRAYVLQMFWIPSESMAPTLLTNDRVAVTKIGDQTHPTRGDVVVFTRPPKLRGTIEHLIKRVIGLPGESVTFVNGKVLVNGQPIAEPYLTSDTVTANLPLPEHCSAAQPCVVPEGHVWVMGDNRSHSEDSRFFDSIDENTIVGRAIWVIWPVNRVAGL